MDPHEQPQRQSTLPDPRTRSRTVLIVDDDDQVLRLLSRWTRQAGLEPAAYQTLEAAETHLLAQPPDVLITDIRLDGWNGLYLVVLAQAYPGVSSIVMTGYHDPVLLEEAVGLNAQFLLKPLTRRALLAAIANSGPQKLTAVSAY